MLYICYPRVKLNVLIQSYKMDQIKLRIVLCSPLLLIVCSSSFHHGCFSGTLQGEKEHFFEGCCAFYVVHV